MDDPRWDDFEAFCEGQHQEPLPAAAETVARFARELRDDGESLDEVIGAMQCVSARHRVTGQPDPTDEDVVHDALDELAAGSSSTAGPGGSSEALEVEVLPAEAKSVREAPESRGQMQGSVESRTGLEAVSEGSAPGLPPIFTGHATPVLQESVGRFYASVEAMFEAWLDRRRSPNTQRAYRRDVMDFVEFLGIKWPEESHRLLQATVPQVQAWRNYLHGERDAAPNTLNRRVSSLSGFYRFMREAASEARLPITVPNPAHSQFIGREVQEAVTPTEALSANRARQLVSLPEGESVLAHRDRAILKLYLYTGARIGTGCRLKVEDFIDDDEDPKVRIQEKGRGKSKRALGVNVIAADALREYIAAAGLTSGPLFRPRKSSRSEKLAERSMDVSTMYRLVQGYLEKLPRAMQEVELEDGKKAKRCIYSPHSLRASTATLLLDAGEDIREVQKLLGHKHVTVTQVYDKRRRGTKDSASHRLSL